MLNYLNHAETNPFWLSYCTVIWSFFLLLMSLFWIVYSFWTDTVLYGPGIHNVCLCKISHAWCKCSLYLIFFPTVGCAPYASCLLLWMWSEDWRSARCCHCQAVGRITLHTTTTRGLCSTGKRQLVESLSTLPLPEYYALQVRDRGLNHFPLYHYRRIMLYR
jgi:hypothetical protein